MRLRQEIKESDWKIFRKLRPLALERFCDRVLAEVGRQAQEPGKTSHERYRALFRLLDNRDRELVEIFDVERRSTALWQIIRFRGEGLMTDEEFAQFSEEGRRTVAGIMGVLG